MSPSSLRPSDLSAHWRNSYYVAVTTNEDAMTEAAIEAEAEGVASTPDGHEITTSIEDLVEVSKALEVKFGEPNKSKLIWRPQNTMAVPGDQNPGGIGC